MMSNDDRALSDNVKLPACNEGAGKDFNGSALSLAAVTLGVSVVYILVLDWRFPYIHQIPVFDLDYITLVTMGWARNWWIEGPWHMLFAMPYSPLSVETATPELRSGMYASWPPGAVASLYLVALLTHTEPNITMVNWLNVAGHGVIALFLALAGYVAAGILRRPRLERVALAILAACLVLFPRGPVYFFSQVYTFDTHIVVFYALLLFAATLEVAAASPASATRCYVAQLVILIGGLFVDWLFYFVYAVWFAMRWWGSRAGYRPKMGRSETIALTLLPVTTFATFLLWRMVTPGSIAAKDGIVASIHELLWKLVFRLGNTDDHPVSFGMFWEPFYESHRIMYWNGAPILIFTAFIACIALFAILFAQSRADMKRRSTYFGLLGIFLLSIVPAYAQLVFFKQHTFIHPWSIAKVVVPLAMVPGVFLPLLTVTVLERSQLTLTGWRWSRAWRLSSSIGVLVFVVWIGAAAWPDQAPYLLGRINPAGLIPWQTIHEKTSYDDVLFSPDFETLPIGMETAIAGKLVYRAYSFSDIDVQGTPFFQNKEGIDHKVSDICVPFNVVIVRKSPDGEETFDGRTPDQVIRGGGLTMLRFQNYRGPAKSCPRV